MSVEGDVDAVVRAEFFPDKRNGVLIEIGAARPDFLSIGASFRKVGWRVISIEPNPTFAQQHRELGHEIYEYACSDHDQENADFLIMKGEGLDYLGDRITYESFSSLGIRGQYQALFARMSDRFSCETIKVNVRKLDTILDSISNLHCLDIICIDVEGWELECLKGFSFGALAPKIAIIENLFQDTDLVEYMEWRNYRLWRRLEPNDIYLLSRPE